MTGRTTPLAWEDERDESVQTRITCLNPPLWLPVVVFVGSAVAAA